MTTACVALSVKVPATLKVQACCGRDSNNKIDGKQGDNESNNIYSGLGPFSEALWRQLISFSPFCVREAGKGAILNCVIIVVVILNCIKTFS